ncbi:hypothetical protein, partial [Phocaeicola vulgatus]|uniref:hypothetical protein n=1 Tax=Phocaeicola vulgatus TaxID=821 RepID=UPI0021088B60
PAAHQAGRVERIHPFRRSLIQATAKKLREALDTYMCDNVGQFGGIAESLGYQSEYRDGYFRFRKDGEELS